LSSDDDVSDRVYTTSKEIIESNLEEFTQFTAKIGNLGELALWLNLSVLFLSGILFLLPSIKLHKRGRVLGY
jgi:hypothetical protein